MFCYKKGGGVIVVKWCVYPRRKLLAHQRFVVESYLSSWSDFFPLPQTTHTVLVEGVNRP